MIKSIYRFFLGISINNFSKNLLSVVEKLKIKNGVSLIDVGAAGDLIPRWKKISMYINYHGFEPDKRSRGKTTEKKIILANHTKFMIRSFSNKMEGKNFFMPR